MAALKQALVQHKGTESLDYEDVYTWQLGLAIAWRRSIIRTEPARCLVSGTGLTHLGSAKNRQAMHAHTATELTDSMKMLAGASKAASPRRGKIGVAPEWFYKGNGTILRAHGEPLDVPAYAEDGGEEAEIAGIYFVGPGGEPCRIGMAIGNEFSDHTIRKEKLSQSRRLENPHLLARARNW